MLVCTCVLHVCLYCIVIVLNRQNRQTDCVALHKTHKTPPFPSLATLISQTYSLTATKNPGTKAFHQRNCRSILDNRPMDRCAVCGQVLRQPPTGRPKLYCDAACRWQAWFMRRMSCKEIEPFTELELAGMKAEREVQELIARIRLDR